MNSDLSIPEARMMLYKKIGFVLTGIMGLLYSIGSNHFAQIHVQIPFIPVPLFVGEIYLAVCCVLLGLKWSSRWPSDRVWVIGWGIYLVWILANAFRGYVTFGPLAFRNAALFYYPLCILLGREFFDRRFFSQNNIILISIVFLLTGAYKFSDLSVYYSYYNFTYVVLYLALLSRVEKRFTRNLLAFGLLIIVPYRDFFVGSRAQLLSFLIGDIFLFSCFFFGLWTLKRWVKFSAVAGALLIVALGLSKYGTESKLKSLVTVRKIYNAYRQSDEYIKEREKTFKFQPLDVQLYSTVNEGEDFFHPKNNQQIQEEIVVSTADEINQRAVQLIEKHQTFENNNLPDQEAALTNYKIEIQRITDRLKFELEGIHSRDASIGMIENAQSQVRAVFAKALGPDATNDDLNSVLAQIQSMSSLIEFEKKTIEEEHNNILFRYFIWRDMIRELFEKKAFFGINWGQPQRSKSIEILGIAWGEWSHDGWITPHNSLIHIIYRAGIIGIILLIGFGAALVRLIRRFLRMKSAVGILCSSVFIYWLVISNFLVILEFPHNAIPFWSLFGFCFAYAYDDNGSKPADPLS